MRTARLEDNPFTRCSHEQVLSPTVVRRCGRSASQGSDWCLLHDPSDVKDHGAFRAALSDALETPVAPTNAWDEPAPDDTTDEDVVPGSAPVEQYAGPPADTYDLTGAYFPPGLPYDFLGTLKTEFGHEVDLSEAVFGSHIEWEKPVFRAGVSLHQAVFREGFVFNGASGTWLGADDVLVESGEFSVVGSAFDEYVSLTESTFNGSLNLWESRFGFFELDGARIEGEASFLSCRFESATRMMGTQFRDDVTMAGSVFTGAAPWECASGDLRDSQFTGASFGRKSDFTDVVFSAPVDFRGARFAGLAVFADTVFEETASFHEVLFGDSALFRATKFLGRCELTSVVADKPNRIRLADALSMQTVELGDTDVSEWSFISAVWPSIVRKVAGTNQHCRGVADESLGVASNATLGVLYRRLQANYERGHGYGTAGDFHIGAMEARRRDLKVTEPTRWLLTAYRTVSLYGERWAWAAFWLVALLVVSASLVVALSKYVGFATALNHCVRVATLQTNLPLKYDGPLGMWGETLLRVLGPTQIAIMVLAIRRQVRR